MLENFHSAETFKLIHSDEKYNIFFDLDSESYKHTRKRMISCILATDMTLHTSQFAYLKLKSESCGINNGGSVEQLFENKDDKEIFHTQQEFLGILLHAADVSNPAKPRAISQKWLVMLCEEFFEQGDKERAVKLPISFMCDRYAVNVPSSQVGFISGFILPLFISISAFFPELRYYCDYAKINKEHFLKIKEEAEKQI